MLKNIKRFIYHIDAALFLITFIFFLNFLIKAIQFEESTAVIVIRFLMVSGICMLFALTYLNMTFDINRALQMLPFIFLILSYVILSAVIPYLGYNLADTTILSVESTRLVHDYEIYVISTKNVLILTVISFTAKYVLSLCTLIDEKYIISIKRRIPRTEDSRLDEITLKISLAVSWILSKAAILFR